MRIWILLSAVLMSCISHSIWATEINVIVNKNLPVEKISAIDLRKIYLGKRSTLADGGKVIPLDASEELPIYKLFYKGVIGKRLDQISSYWSRMLFTGKGRPPEQIYAREDVVAKVSSNSAYIAYVEGDVDADKVKVVFTLELP